MGFGVYGSALVVTMSRMYAYPHPSIWSLPEGRPLMLGMTWVEARHNMAKPLD